MYWLCSVWFFLGLDLSVMMVLLVMLVCSMNIFLCILNMFYFGLNGWVSFVLGNFFV